jgi:hypothetical protein
MRAFQSLRIHYPLTTKVNRRLHYSVSLSSDQNVNESLNTIPKMAM